mmetsp:Transcript_13693/g.15591  ORF Transcript_13693/g.15591 Transcript_13693/m.15591 type:complete len:85 (+) Transcript_13693:287-541(+)
MGRLQPLLWGTITFAALWSFFYVLGYVFVATKKLGRPERSLYTTFVSTAAICMWMMWAMVWMSQANPILVPEGTPIGDDHHRIL